MTENQIKQRKELETMPYDIALKLRQELNEYRKQYNALGGSWDDDDCECTICEMVFDEG